MKTAISFYAVLMIMLCVSCTHDNIIDYTGNNSNNNNIKSDTARYFTARVSGLDNTDCHLSEIVFTGDTTGISKILDNETYSYSKTEFELNPYKYTFLAKNLDNNLKIKDYIIKFKFRLPLADEYPVCTAFGPAYPVITILTASKAN